MATQPSYRPFRESKFFSDRRASRPLVPGTVARGSQIATGLKTLQPDDWAQMVGMVGNVSAAPLTAASTKLSAYVDAFPEPITLDTLEQGRQRYDIFCSA